MRYKKTVSFSIFLATIGVSITPPCISEEILGLRLAIDQDIVTLRGDYQTPDIVTETESIIASRFSPHEVGIESSWGNRFTLDFRHHLPIVPRLRLAQRSTSWSGTRALQRDLQVSDTVFANGAIVGSDAEIQQQFIEAYYTLVDSWLIWEVGLQQLNTKGSLSLQTLVAATDDPDTEPDTGEANEATTIDIEENVLQLVSNLLVYLPETPMAFGLDLDYVDESERHFNETSIYTAYLFALDPVDISFKLGFRRNKMMSRSFGETWAHLASSGPFFQMELQL